MDALAVDNAPLLRRLQGGVPPATEAALARELGREKGNFAKTLARLQEAGIIARKPLALTALGERCVQALDLADGRLAVPDGLVALTHAQLAPDPENPRKDFETEDALADLADLADSIAGQGLQQNLVARAEPDANGVRVLVAGERRWRAIGLAIQAGRLPADWPIPVRLHGGDATERALLALVENILRRDLNPVEEARAYQALTRPPHALGTAAIAARARKSRKHVQDRLKLLSLPEETLARLALPKDDPEHLTYTQARGLMQAHRDPAADQDPPPQDEGDREAVDGTPGPAPPAAPPAADLTPAQALLLYEIDAAIRARPELKAPLGPTAKYRSYSEPMRQADVAALVGEGMIALDQRADTVALLKPGQAWLAGRPGAFMEPDWKLQHARKAAGLDEARIAQLEQDEAFAADWLNLPKPKPPRPFTPAEALLLFEVYDAAEKTGNSYRGAEVAWDVDQALLQPHRDAGLISGGHEPHHDGRVYVRTDWYVMTDLAKAYPGQAGDDKRRAKHLAKLRAEVLGAEAAAALGDRYATPWLNGPFPPSPDAQAKADEEARRHAAAEAKAQAAAAERGRFKAAVEAFETALPGLDAAEAAERWRALLEDEGLAGPWRPFERAYADDWAKVGERTITLGDEITPLRRLLIVGLNLAQGLPPADWADPRYRDLDRDAFEAAMADAVLAAEPGADRDGALAACRRFLAEYLEDEGLTFGGPGLDWTAAAAAELVGEYDISAFDAEAEPAEAAQQ